jgi:hypothetical protein
MSRPSSIVHVRRLDALPLRTGRMVMLLIQVGVMTLLSSSMIAMVAIRDPVLTGAPL